MVARAALHFWEEPPLSGKAGSGAVFFAGCPLQCAYCQNAAIAGGNAGVSIDVDRLARIFLELADQGALNINCVTPTQYAPCIVQAVHTARRDGLCLPIAWNTSGYETEAAVRALESTVDVWLTDFKYATSPPAARYSHAPDYPRVALAALDAMVEQTGEAVFDEVDGLPRLVRGVIVRHLVLPGGLEDSKRVIELLWKRYGSRILLSVMSQYTPVLSAARAAGNARAYALLERFPELGTRVSGEDYEELLDFADAIGVEDYFWQEGSAADESFVPAWDGSGVLSTRAL